MAWATLAETRVVWSDAPTDDAVLTPFLDAAFEQCVAYAPSLAAVVLRDAVLTSGSATLTSATATFSSRDEGRGVTGTGIPDGTSVSYVTSSTEVVLSASATASGSDVTVTLAALTPTESHKLANAMQARDLYTATQRGDTSADVIGFGDFAIRARPLSAPVRALLRPQGHSLLGFA